MLLDITLPDINGLEVARQVKAQPRRVVVVLVSLHDTPAYQLASKSVADGFVCCSRKRAWQPPHTALPCTDHLPLDVATPAPQQKAAVINGAAPA
jgi:CheY-like chemotaxis protein